MKSKVEHIEQYDVVFVGFPTWDMQMPPPLRSFLTHYSLKGKTVVPFNTNAGYGVGSGFQTLMELCPESTVREGFVAEGGLEKEGKLRAIEGAKAKEVQTNVEQWLMKNKVLG